MNLLAEPREIVLRPYQSEAVQRLRDGISLRALLRQILVAPTGAGKTVMAMEIIKSSQRKGATAWFIVDRVTLIDQTSATFTDFGIQHGVVQADHPMTDRSQSVQVWSAQTLARRSIRDDEIPKLIVVDECHCRYEAVRKLVERAVALGSKVLGLTATPFSAGMAEDWDGLVNSATTNQLIAMGMLTPLRIKACVRPDMVGARQKKDGEYEEEDAGQRGITIVGDVLSTWVAETNKAFGGPVKTIVFSPSVKHGAELCRQFAAAGYNFQQLSHLDRDENERRAKIAEFRKPDSAIHGLVSCAVLTKGFDVPDVLCGISCRPYRKSFSSHIQELGRVMRIAEGKSFGLWLDHSGNAVAFAEDTAWLYEYGVDSLSNAAKKDSEVREPKEVTRKEHFCGDCGVQLPPRAENCPACGWERPARDEIRIVQGELIDVDFTTGGGMKARHGLHAECLKDPKAIWNAALAYTLSHTRKGDAVARKWALGIWKGIYPDSKLPRGLYDAPVKPDGVRPAQWSLIDREVARFRKNNPARRAA